MNTMTLNMSQGPAGVQQLRPDQHLIFTDSMGDCVSVIVLYNLDKRTFAYAEARGQHGNGGIDYVDFKTLLRGVPNNRENRIIVIPGTQHTSRYAQDHIKEFVKNATRMNHQLLTIKILTARSSAKIDRFGEVVFKELSQ